MAGDKSRANSPEALEALSGQTIRGFLAGEKAIYLITEDGDAICFKDATGILCYWWETEANVSRMLQERKTQLEATKAELERVLRLAGETAEKKKEYWSFDGRKPFPG